MNAPLTDRLRAHAIAARCQPFQGVSREAFTILADLLDEAANSISEAQQANTLLRDIQVARATVNTELKEKCESRERAVVDRCQEVERLGAYAKQLHDALRSVRDVLARAAAYQHKEGTTDAYKWGWQDAINTVHGWGASALASAPKGETK